MAQNSAGGVGFGSIVSSLFGGDAGKKPGAAHARMPGKGGILSEVYWANLIPALLLIAYGLVVVWSASLSNVYASLPRQAVGAVLGLVAAAFVWRYDCRALANMSTWLLVIDVVLMLSPRIPGLASAANGMTGWVKLGPLRFQPSEIGKLVTIFLMASLAAQYTGRIKELRDYVKLCGTLLVPFAAIMAQPDLGTATQSAGGFLPENHTDFIFARLAEEFGFVGAVALLALYAWLIYSALALAMRVDAPFAKLVLTGVIAMWSYQLLQNVGMCIGIMPITGIPLPFVSYGSTSMVIQVASVGIVQSVYLHRTKSA